MYICETCGKETEIKYGSGRFCCRACANTRKHSEETKKKIGLSVSKNANPWNRGIRLSQETIDKRKETFRKNHPHIKKYANCAYCGTVIDISNKKQNINNRYFCNGTCRNLLLNATKEIGGIYKGYNVSAWEKQFQNLLQKYNIKFEANKRDLIPSHYEIDLWLPEQKVAIELNGIWHYSSKPYGGNEDALKRRQEKDRIKKEQVLNLGYKFFVFEDRDIKDVNIFFENFIKNELLNERLA